MSNRNALWAFLILRFISFASGEEENVEATCNINVKKPAQCVSEKFLSISVDPAVLLAGVNLSENSLRLAKHLSPAYIRIAGPSTQFVKYEDHHDDKTISLLSEDGSNFKITPAIWFGVNEWLKLAKLMPIFGINDAETARGLWNPKATLPLFEISENLNISCYWQLGYDSSEKNETRYKQDINILHYILTAYGARNDTWKIIGSDISTMPADRIESIMMEENDVIEAVMWEPSGRGLESFPQKDTAYKLLAHPSAKPRTKMWTTVPKLSEPVTFAAALMWAKQVGVAAKMGYGVIFRQPRVYELFTETPIYWFSVLHKELMGCHVLDVKSPIFQEETDIFAHCTRKQNRFVRRGASTVLIVNDRPGKYKVKVKLGNSLPEKSMEIQSYLLSSDSKNSTNVYLNGKLLTMKVFQEKIPFQPKIRRTKTSSHILLSLPPSTIGFFVLPGARVPICIDKEKETQLLLEEIEENQNNGLSEEIALQLGSRASFNRNNMLEQITKKLKDEMTSDEKYYKGAARKSDTNKMSEVKAHDVEDKVDEKGRKLFIDRIKFADKHKKALEFQKKTHTFKAWLDKSKSLKDSKIEKKPKKMDLTSEEIEKILKERAIDRAGKKNILFTDEELDALIRKASKSFNLPKEKRAVNKDLLERLSKNSQPVSVEFDDPDFYKQSNNLKIRDKRNVHNIKKRVRGARGINFNLLDLKSRIAEHKKMWKDKKESLLGNSNSLKESIKDKIRGLKSQHRFRRNIDKDALKKSIKKKKKTDINKVAEEQPNIEVEATIRKYGQTTAEILEEWERSHPAENVDDDEEEVFKGEVFAELADSEDSDDELFIEPPPPKQKKIGLFNKKPKLDPFAVAHPTIDIIGPSSSKKSKKKKNKIENELQFLTTSEEFTDIEDDVPSIHEYFGPNKNSGQKKDRKGSKKEMYELYEVPKLNKREVHKFKPKDIPRMKRSMGFSIVKMAKFDDDLKPDELLQQILFDPLLELPLLNELYKYDANSIKKNNDFKNIPQKQFSKLDKIILQKMEGKPDNSTEKANGSISSNSQLNRDIETTTPKDVGNILEELESIPSKSEDVSNQSTPFKENPSIEDFSVNYENDNHPRKKDYNPNPVKIDEHSSSILPFSQESNEKYDESAGDRSQSQNKPESEDKEILENPFDPFGLEQMEDNTEPFRKKRSIPESTDEHKKKKKVKCVKKKPHTKKEDQMILKQKANQKNENQFLTEQINIIKDKLEERKCEIDKRLKKQKQTEQDIKKHWKSKLTKRKNVIKPEKDSEDIPSRSKASKTKLKNTESKQKRSVFEPSRVVFGDYKPPTIKKWKPSDISSFKKDIHFAKKTLPPDDYKYFKNIFHKNKPIKLRTRRFIDTDVDSMENEIDANINEIKKEPFVFDFKTEKDPESFINDEGKNKLKTLAEEYNNKNVVSIPVSKNDEDQVIQKINDKEDDIIIKTTNKEDSTLDNKPIKNKEDLVNEGKVSSVETSIKDGDYRFKLPNDDEFEIIKTGEDTEIVFMHHNQGAATNFDNDFDSDLWKKENSTFIPKIVPRSMKPFEDIEEFFGNVKKLFDKVGKEVKSYFNNIGLRF